MSLGRDLASKKLDLKKIEVDVKKIKMQPEKNKHSASTKEICLLASPTLSCRGALSERRGKKVNTNPIAQLSPESDEESISVNEYFEDKEEEDRWRRRTLMHENFNKELENIREEATQREANLRVPSPPNLLERTKLFERASSGCYATCLQISG